VAVPHVVTVCHVAHYRADLSPSPKKVRPANGRGRDPWMNIPRYLVNGLRARFESRGCGS
jgi:hypothetical protein